MNVQFYARSVWARRERCYRSLPMCYRSNRGIGSSWSPVTARVSATATDATDRLGKRMAREGVLVGCTGKWGVGGGHGEYDRKTSVASVAVPLQCASSPVTARVLLLPVLGVAPRPDPITNAHEMRTRIKTQIGSNAQDLRITAKKAEVGK